MQLTLEFTEADEKKILQLLGPKSVARTYTWEEKAGTPSVANLVDQMSLVTGKRKPEVVAIAVRLAALYIKLAGPEALEKISSCRSVEELQTLVGTI